MADFASLARRCVVRPAAANIDNIVPASLDRHLVIVRRADALFPPTLARTVMPALAAAGVDARCFEIDTPHGHFGSDLDVAQCAPTLATFLAELAGLP